MSEDPSESLESIKERLTDTRQRLDLANRHINTLFNQVQDLEIQFKAAIKNKKHSARHNLRQRLAVVMGLKIVYLNYCTVKTLELEQMNQKLHTMIELAVEEAMED